MKLIEKGKEDDIKDTDRHEEKHRKQKVRNRDSRDGTLNVELDFADV